MFNNDSVKLAELFQIIRETLNSCGYSYRSQESNDFFVPKMSYVLGVIVKSSCWDDEEIAFAKYCGENLFVRENGHIKLHCDFDIDNMVVTMKLFSKNQKDEFLENMQAIAWAHIFKPQEKILLNIHKLKNPAHEVQEVENQFFRKIKKHS